MATNVIEKMRERDRDRLENAASGYVPNAFRAARGQKHDIGVLMLACDSLGLRDRDLESDLQAIRFADSLANDIAPIEKKYEDLNAATEIGPQLEALEKEYRERRQKLMEQRDGATAKLRHLGYLKSQLAETQAKNPRLWPNGASK